MKNKARKLLAMLLALGMVAGLTGITAFAQEAPEAETLDEVLASVEEAPSGETPAAVTPDEVPAIVTLDEVVVAEPAESVDEAVAALSEEIPDPVASVDGVGYASLGEAIEACDIGGTVTLLKDQTLMSLLQPSKSGITLDLGGYTLTFNRGGLQCNSTIIIQNGTLAAGARCDCPLTVNAGGNVTVQNLNVTGSTGVTVDNGMLTVEDGATITAAKTGVSIRGNNSDNCIPENEDDCARLTVNGGSITGGDCGIAGEATGDGTVIHLIAGTVTGTNGVGVAHPQYGSLTIEKDMDVTGKVGVQIMGGQLTVNGGSITATDTKTYSAPKKVGGYYLDGAAVSVITNTELDRYGNKPFGDVSVTIVDGVFTAQEGNKVAHIYDMANGTEGPAEGASLTVEGGWFSSKLDSEYLDGVSQDENGNVVSCTHAGTTVTVTEGTYPATCVAPGQNAYRCTLCGKTWTEEVPVDPDSHDLVRHEGKAATCTEGGWDAYDACSREGCGYTTYRATAPLGHSIETVSGRVEPTCTTPGQAARTHCTRCGGTWGGEVIPAAHKPVSDNNAVEPTCQHTGLTASTSCSVCHTRLTEQRVLAVTDHRAVTDPAKEPTCTETGLTEGSHCGFCNTVLVAQEVRSAKGHTTVVDPAKAPTCTETGLTEGSHCVSCGAAIIAQQVVPAKGHTLTVSFTHTADSQVTATCSVCGYEFTTRAQVTSETSGSTTTYTATVTIDGVGYTDIWSVTRPSDGGSSGGGSGSAPVEDPGVEDPSVEDLDDLDTPLADKPFLFDDVKEDDWYYNDVKTVFNSSLMSGVNATTFQPFADTTRAMVAQILYRMSGEPAVDGVELTIADVPQNAWYHDAAVWACANGIFTGYGDGSFRGDVNVTREQLVTVLYRYAQKEGYDTSASADLSAYEDQSQTGAWAVDAMGWAVASGLIQGRGANRVAPQEGAMRVELAVILNRFVDKFVPATVLA